MSISKTTYWILVISVIIFLVIAIIAIIIIFFRIYKIKRKIKINNLEIEKKLSNKPSEKKMRERKDLGEPIFQLQDLLKNTISHEIVEFCINSCIRNHFKKVLLIGDVEIYEAISISNKADVDVYVDQNNFPNQQYNNIKDKIQDIKHKLVIFSQLDIGLEFDAIISLNSLKDFDKLFLNYQQRLKNKGMFIFANTKANKKSAKTLITIAKEQNYRFETINWYTGFIVLVK